MTPLLQAGYVHLTFKVALVGNFARRANVANPVCVGLGPRVLLLRRAEFRIRRQVWRRSHANVHTEKSKQRPRLASVCREQKT